MHNVLVFIIVICAIALGFIYFQEASAPSIESQVLKSGSSAYDATWLRSFEQATATAKTEHKKILMVFTGSDWCSPCKSLHKFVFKDQHFIDYAKKNIVLLVVDFPKGRTLEPKLVKHNAALKKRFSPMGYPTMVMVNSEGNEVGRFPYMYQKPIEFTNKITKYLKERM